MASVGPTIKELEMKKSSVVGNTMPYMALRSSLLPLSGPLASVCARHSAMQSRPILRVVASMPSHVSSAASAWRARLASCSVIERGLPKRIRAPTSSSRRMPTSTPEAGWHPISLSCRVVGRCSFHTFLADLEADSAAEGWVGASTKVVRMPNAPRLKDRRPMSKVSPPAMAMSRFVMRSGAACTGAGTAMDLRLRAASCCSASASAIDTRPHQRRLAYPLCLL